MHFLIYALVCGQEIPHAECQPGKASQVAIIGEASSEIACAVQGQQLSPPNVEIGEGDYLKIACFRRERG